MPHKRGEPGMHEVVICRVSKVNPNSAYCELLEYPGKEALIHIGEVSRGWVRDIRRFVKEGKIIVAVVIRTEPLSLSLKRVQKRRQDEKVKEWNMEKRAEKMLEAIAKARGMSLDKAYEEIGYALQETFGTLYGAFKEALHRPERLKKHAGDWFDNILEVAKKEIGEKTYQFSAELTIRSTSPEGLEKIREVLEIIEKEGLEIKYIAAPKYMAVMNTNDPKKGKKQIEEKLEKIGAMLKDVDMKFVVK